ncbi:T9SS type A sorting domain-containing protein [candidate division WOR-3 bacterium]|nr:T9SS type A sorting domain-containing protein [candidate division WOR-3 bacterium]
MVRRSPYIDVYIKRVNHDWYAYSNMGEDGYNQFQLTSGYKYKIWAEKRNCAAAARDNKVYDRFTTETLQSGHTYTDTLHAKSDEEACILDRCYWALKFSMTELGYTPPRRCTTDFPSCWSYYSSNNDWYIPGDGIETIHITKNDAFTWTASHEFGHFVDDVMYGDGKNTEMRSDHSIDKSKHFMNSKKSPMFALSEAWAHFIRSGAREICPYSSPSSNADDFYANKGNRPYWRDGAWDSEYKDETENMKNQPPYSCEHGDSVEGSVHQFMWDLWDSDPDGGYDDDGLSDNGTKIKTILINDQPHSIGEFINGWNSRSYGNINELDSVILHRKGGTENYVVPEPTNFKPSYDFANDELDLTWTDNTKNEGHFIIKYGSTKYYTGPNSTSSGSYTIDPAPTVGYEDDFSIQAVTADTSGLDSFHYGHNLNIGFHNDEGPILENSPWASNPVNVGSVIAQKTTSQYYYNPPYSTDEYSYKFSGTDNSSSGSYAYYNLFNIWAPILEPQLGNTQGDPYKHTFLSAWFKTVSSPGDKGHISFDGILDPWDRLENFWDDDYGWIVDQYGQRIDASIHNTLTDGSWKQYIYNLAPAHQNMIKNLSIAYNDSMATETGDFEAYIDLIYLMHQYPNTNEWFVEVFGGDKNADVTWDWHDQQIDLIVDGNGVGDQTAGWVSDKGRPRIRKKLSPYVTVEDNDIFSWEQYDKDHALIFSLLVSENGSTSNCKWLSYAANASNHWSEPGFVNMGEEETCYDEWEPFSRDLVDDYNAEYDPDVTSLKIMSYRLGHYAKREWDGDHGGSVRGISLVDGGYGGGSGGLPSYQNLILETPNGGERWEIGTVHDIVWLYYVDNDPNLEGFQVQVCTNYGQGNTWETVGYVPYNGSAAAYCIEWDIPTSKNPSKICRARVLAMNENNGIQQPMGGDMSDANFEIYKLFIGPSPEPFAEFVWPPEEQEGIICSNPIPGGGEMSIGWVTHGVNPLRSVTLQYSTDGGATFQTIAEDLDPGEDEVVFDSTEVDTGWIFYSALQGSYRWDIPQTPTCGGKFRYVVYDSTGDSAEYVFTETFTIPFGAGSMTSTAYTGNKITEGTSKVRMVFTDNFGAVKYTESEDGFEWSAPQTASSTGETPSAYTVDDSSVVLWRQTSYVNKEGMYSTIAPGGYSEAVIPHPYLEGNILQKLSETSLVTHNDSIYVSLFRSGGVFSGVPIWLSCHLITARSSQETAFGIDQLDTVYSVPMGITPVTEAPAFAIDNEGNRYYAFNYAGNTVFIYDDGSNVVVDTISASSVGYPSLDVTAGNVYLTYASEDGRDTIISRIWRYTGDTLWRGTDTVYEGSVKNLGTTKGVYTLLTDGEDNMKLAAFDPIERETETSMLADSVYNPHIEFSRFTGENEIALIWTERTGNDYYVMSDRLSADALLPHCYIECGSSSASPFTTTRDTFRTYPGVEVDVGDTLDYSLVGLDTTLDYDLTLEFYFEDTVPSKDFIVTIGSQTDTVTVPDSSLTRYKMEIDTLTDTLTIQITGEDAELARLILYESDGSEGGYYLSGTGGKTDVEELTKLPFEFCLENVMPNPFTRTAQISFAMPVAQPVTLKVYDVTGREVRTLVSGVVKAGVHSLQWNGEDNSSRPAPSGVYFVRMMTDGYQASRKIVFVR